MRKNKEYIVNEMLLKNYEKYYRIAYGYVYNEADALDVVQEGAYKAILNADKLKKPEYADTWICRIMMNEALELLRRNKKNEPGYLDERSGREETYEDLDLKNAMERLSERDRMIVVLRYFEDMSLDQVAQAIGENLSTVKSRLYRALAKLRLSLEEA